MAEHAKIATDSNSGEVLCGGCFQKFTCKLTYIDHQISCQPSQQQLFGHQDAYRNTGNYTNTCGNTVDTNTTNKLPQSSTCSTEPNIGTSHASSAYVKSVCVKQDVDNIQEELMKKEVSQDSGSATKRRSISSVHRHTCDHCNKTYSRKDHLSRHRLVHTGVKDFQCTYCGKEFYRKDKLQRHKKTHEGSSLFVCQTCGKKFTRKEKLNQHESTHLNS